MKLRNGKRSLITLIVSAILGILMICATVIGFTGLNFNGAKTAEATATGTKIDLGTGGFSGNATAKTNLPALFKAIAGTSNDTYAKVKKSFEKDASNKDIPNGTIIKTALTSNYVTMGGYNWNIMAVSKDSSGDVVVTLWMATEFTTKSVWNEQYTWNTSSTYPSNMYSSSKIRSFLMGKSYTTNGSSLGGSSVQNSAFSTLITNYGTGAKNVLDTPSQIAYQGTESATATIGFSKLCPNEAYGTPSSGSWNTGYNYAGKGSSTGVYDNWKEDKLWLPSLTETGYNDTYTGLWKTTKDQRASGGTYTWLRSGHSSYCNSAYVLYADGSTATHDYVSTTYGVRPALHLNLKSAASAAGLSVAEVTKVAPPAANYATGTTSFTYTGSAQTLIKGYSDTQFTATLQTKKIDASAYGTATEFTTLADQTNAGNYRYSFTPKSGYTWEDGTTTAKTVDVTIKKADLYVGLSYETTTYGTDSSPTLTVKRGTSSGTVISAPKTPSYTVTGGTTSYPGNATQSSGKLTPSAAGKINVKVDIAASDNYNAGTANVDVTIGRKAIAIPAANYATGTTSFTFTGAAQTLVKNWNKDQMSATYQYAPYATGTGIDGGTAVTADTAIASTTTALNYTHAGVYTFKITPNGNHQWNTGTGTALTETKTVTVTVAKAAITVTYSSYGDKAYTGDPQGPSVAVSIPTTVTANKPSTTVTDTNSYTQTDFTGTTVDTYTATFALKDKYKNNFYFTNGSSSCTAVNGAATGNAAVSATRSYNITNASITVSVAKNSGLTAITASGTTFSWTYNGTTYSLSGVTGTTAATGNVLTACASTVNGQTATWKFKAGTTAPSTSDAGESFSFKDVADAKTISYRVSAPNHADATGTITISISKRAITVNIADKTSVYGDDLLTFEASLATDSSFATGEGADDIYSISSTVTKLSNVGDYDITGSTTGKTKAANYDVTFNKGTYSLTQRTLTVTESSVVVADKTYDGTTDGALTGTIAVTNKVTGTDVSVSGTVAFATKNAAVANTATVTLSLTGAAAGNYTLNKTSLTVDKQITRAKITAITGIAKLPDKVYDATRDGEAHTDLDGTFEGIVSGETLVIASATYTYAQASVGADLVVTITDITLGDSTTASNYLLALKNDPTVLGDIVQCEVIITESSINVAPKTYDGTTAGKLTGNVEQSGLIEGTIATIKPTVTYTTKNAGDTTVTVTFTLEGAAAANYKFRKDSFEFNTTIAQREITAIHGAYKLADKTYDGTTVGTLSNLAATTFDGIVDGEKLVIASATTVTYDSADVGTNIEVTISGITLGGQDGTSANNYKLALTEDPTSAGDIVELEVTVEWGNDTLTYDGTSKLPTATVKYGTNSKTLSGWTDNGIGGLFATVSAGAFEIEVNISLEGNDGILLHDDIYAVDAGKYTVYTSLDDNFKQPDGKDTAEFTINPKGVTVNWGGLTHVYDNTEKEATYTLTGVVEGDVVGADLTYTATTGTLGANSKPLTVGSYTVSGELDSTNYTIAANPTATLTIGKLNVSAAWTNTEIGYTGVAQLPEMTLTAGSYTATVAPSDWTSARGADRVYVHTADAVFTDGSGNEQFTITLTLIVDNTTGTAVNKGNYSLKSLEISSANKDNFSLTTGVSSLDFSIAAMGVAISWGESTGFINDATIPTANVTLANGEKVSISTWTKTVNEGGRAILRGTHKFSDTLTLTIDVTVSAKSGSSLTGGYAVNVGNYGLNATVDTTMFKITSGSTANFEISASEVNFEWTGAQFTYNGKNQKPAVSYNGSEITLTQQANNTYTASITVNGAECQLTFKVTEKDQTAALKETVNAGSYTMSAESSNAKINNSTFDFTIDPQTVTITWSEDELVYNGLLRYPAVSCEGKELEWTQGADNTTYSVTVNYGEAECVIGLKLDKEAINAGDYAATLSVSNNFTFKADEKVTTLTQNYTIKPAAKTINVEDTDLSYTGSDQLPDVSVDDNYVDVTSWVYADGKYTQTVDGCLITLEVSGTKASSGKAINAGDYSIKVSVSDNYTLDADSQVTEKSGSFSIGVRHVNVSLENDQLTYNGKAQTPTVVLDTGVEGLTVDCETETGKYAGIWTPVDAINFGSYVVEIIITDTNFVLVDEDGEEAGMWIGLPFEIVKLELGIEWPQDTGKGITLTYTGSELLPEINLTLDGTGYAVTLSDGTGSATVNGIAVTLDYTLKAVTGSLSSGHAVEEGVYKLAITLGDNFKISDDSFDNYDYEIKKAVADTIEFSVESKSYDGKLPEVEAKGMPSDIKATYKYYVYSETATNNLGEEVTASEAVNVGKYVVAATFHAPATYADIEDKYATFEIYALEIDVEDIGFSGTSAQYTGRAQSVTLTGDLTGIASYTFVYEKDGVIVSEAINAGNYNVTVTFVAERNYVLKNGVDNKTTTLNVEKVNLYIKANDVTVSYGDDAKEPGVTASGFVNRETVDELGGALVFDFGGYTAGSPVRSTPYTITPSGYTSDNYNIIYQTGSLIVTQRVLEVKWYESNAVNAPEGTHFTYVENNGAVYAPYAVAANALAKDTVTLTVEGEQSAAGFGYTAKVSGVSNSSYVLPVNGATATFDIIPNPKTGKIIWDSTTLYYNGTTQLPKAYYYANESDTEPTALTVKLVGSTVPRKAGTYKARVTVPNGLTLSGQTEIEFRIEKRPVYIVLPDMEVIEGETIDLSKLNWKYLDGSLEFVASDNYKITLGTTAGANATANTYPIKATFTSSNAANYEVTFTGSWQGEESGKWGTLTIKGASSADLSNLTYVGTTPTYDGTAHEITIVGLPAGINAELTYYKNGVEEIGHSGVTDAGEYTVNIDYKDLNGELLDSVTLTMTVKKAALTIKANDASTEYGNAAMSNGYTATGFVNGDDEENALKGAAVYTFVHNDGTTEYEAGNTVGSYRVRISGFTADNYDITYVDGVLTVGKRTLIITWVDGNGVSNTHFSYEYDGVTTFAPDVEISNLYGTDAIGTALTYEVKGGKSEAGVNYVATIEVTSDLYQIPTDGSESVTFDVIPEANEIVWDNEPLYYKKDTAQAPKAYYYDGTKLVELTVTGQEINVGKNYTATVEVPDGLTLSGSTTCTFEILPQEITVTISDKSYEYVSGDKTEDYVLECDSDIAGIILTSTGKKGSDVGTYEITGECTNGNYKVTFVPGTLTITKATYEIPEIEDGTAEYDGTSKQITLPALPAGVTAKVTYKQGGVDLGANGAVNAGEYAAVITFTGDSVNYNAIPSREVKFTITEKEISVGGYKFDDDSVVYDGKAHTLTVSGTVTGIAGVTYEYYNGTDKIKAEEVVNAGTYTVKAIFTAAANYTLSEDGNSREATLTIEEATLTVAANDHAIAYGETAVANGYTITGFVNGETVSVVSGTATVNVESATDYTVGTYALTVDETNSLAATNYTFVYAEGTLTVTPATLEIEWDGGANNFIYHYDSENVQTYAPTAKAYATINGVKTELSSLTLTVSGGKSEIGENYLATVTGVTGTGAENFVLPVEGASHTFSIIAVDNSGNPVKYQIVWNNAPMYYSGKAQAPTAYYVDEDGNEVKLTVTVDEGEAISVGTYTARIAVPQGATLDGDTYKQFSIEKRTVYVVIPDAEASFGETPNMDSLLLEYLYPDDAEKQFVESDVNIVFSHDTVTGVGKYKISGKLSNYQSNYTVVFTGSWVSADAENGRYGTLTVNKADFDVSNVRYGSTEFTYDGQSKALEVYGVPADVTVTKEYFKDGFSYGATGVTGAGVYTVVVTFTSGNTNYNGLGSEEVTLTIKKAPLTIKANDNTIHYGDAPAASGYTPVGLVNGETVSVLLGGDVYSYNYARLGDIGSYVITPSGLTSDNYEITFVSGTLTVLPLEVQIEWYSDNTLTNTVLNYNADGNVHTPYAVVTNAIGGERVTLTVSGGQSAAGVGYVATVTGISNTNYAIPSGDAATTLFNVLSTTTKYEVIWAVTELVYNGQDQTPKAYYIDGNGDLIELEVTVSGAHANAGVTYTATVTEPAGITLTGDKSKDYTIGKQKLTVELGNYTAVYGEAISLTYVGEYSYLNITLTYNVGDGNVGEYDVNATYANDNYDVKFVAGTLTVTKATYSFTASVTDTATYDGNAQQLTVTGLPDDVNYTVTYYKDGVEYGTNGVVEVGEYTAVITYTGDDNHNAIPSQSTTFKVTPATTSLDGIDFAETTYNVTYNGKAQNVYVEGSANGITSVSYTYYKGSKAEANRIDADEAVNVGTYIVVATFTVDGNYTLSGDTERQATIVIGKAQLTVKANDKTLTYGEAVNANGYGYTISGFVNGDTINVVSGSANVNVESATKYVVDTYAITASANSLAADNYTFRYEGGILTVVPLEIKVNWTGGNNFVFTYNGEEQGPEATVTNVIGSDDISLTVGGKQIKVGTGYVATVVAITGDDAANYVLPVIDLTHTFDILETEENSKNLIVWDNSPLYYNGENRKPSAYFIDENGTKVDLIVNVDGESRQAGYTYRAYVTADSTLGLIGDMYFDFEVLALPVYVVIGDVTVPYGSAIDSTAYTWSYLTDAEFLDDNFTITFSTLAVAGSDVGKYKIFAEFSAINANNYNVTFTGSWASTDADNGKCGTLTVSKATFDSSTLVIGGTETTYNGENHTISISGLPADITAHVTYLSNGWSYDDNGVKETGVYTVNITFVYDTDKYNPISNITATLTVNKATLTIKANDNTIVYGDAPAANGYTVSGFIKGEGEDGENADLGNLGTLTFTYNYSQYGNVGSYLIIPGGISSDKYDIVFETGVLTVEQRVLTVEWYSDKNMTSAELSYRFVSNSTYFMPYAAAGNLVNGDKVTLTVTGAQSKAGLNYVAQITAVSNPNYQLPASGTTAKFDILPKVNTVVWDNSPIYYDGKNHKPEAYYFDDNGNKIPLTDRVQVDGSVSGASGVGKHVAEITGDTSNLNGNLSISFEILKREITIIITGADNVQYGNLPDTLFSWALAEGSLGFLTEADASKVAVSCKVDNTSPAGTYAVTGAYPEGNYSVTFIDGTLVIGKADYNLDVTFDGLTVEYDGKYHKLELVGEIPEGVTYVITYVKDGVRYDGDNIKEVGTYTATVTFTCDTINHNAIPSLTATLVITEKTLDLDGIKFEDVEVTYDGKAHTIYVSGDMNGFAGVTYTYYDGNDRVIDASRMVNAGTYKIVAKFTADGNYALDEENSTKTAYLTIDKAVLTVTANDHAISYGDDAVANGYTITGFVNGETVNAVSGSATVNVESATTYSVGTYALTVDKNNSLEAANYSFVYADGTLTVTRKTISIEWYDAEGGNPLTGSGFEYVNNGDGTKYLPYAKAVGTLDGEEITLTVITEQSATGFGYVATVKGIDGDDAANYALPLDNLTCTFTIVDAEKVPGKIIWDYTTLYYDGTAQAPKAYYYESDDESAVPVEITDITVDGEAIKVGTYTATATLNGVTGTYEFRIEPRKVYVSINDVTARYGESVQLGWQYYSADAKTHFIGKDGADITLSVVWTDGEGEIGEYRILGAYPTGTNYEVIFIGNRATTDEYNYKCGTLKIEKATPNMQNVTFSDTTVDYDGKYHKFEVTSDLPEGVTGYKVSYSLNGWISDDVQGVKTAGVYRVEVTFTVDSAHYNEVSSFTTTFTINKVALIITANDSEIYYGNEAVSNGVSYSIEGIEDVLDGTPVYTFNYKLLDKVGSYVISVSGIESDNFDIEFVPGVLTVKPRPVSIIWLVEEGGAQSGRITYSADGTEHKPYAQVVGLVDGQSVKATVEGGYVQAGMNYEATVTALNDSNYALPIDGSGTVYFDIIPQSYEIVWEKTNFVYNGEEQAPKAYYYTNNGEQVELDVTVEGYHADANTYVAVASLKGGTVTISGEFRHTYTIAKREVSIVISDVEAAYGSTPADNGWNYGANSAEFVSGSPIILTVNASATSNVGLYGITGVCTNANYDVKFADGTYEVIKATVTVPAVSDVEYTGKRVYASLESSDLYSVLSNTGGITVDECEVVLLLTDFTNYKWSTTDAQAVVIKYNIVKAENEWTAEYEIEGWTVVAGENDGIPDNKPAAKFGTPVVKYYRDENCYVEVSREFIETTTTSNTYYVKVTVEGTDNYGGLEFVHAFRISGRRAVTLHWDEKVLTYNGEMQAPKAYIVVDGDVIWLTVEGSNKGVGVYSATATLVGLDGVDYSTLYDIYDGEDAEEITIDYEIKAVVIVVTIGDINTVYGEEAPDVADVIHSYDTSLVIAGDELGLSFTCNLGSGKYPAAGVYAIVGNWTNGNYELIFEGSWTEGDLGDNAGTYTVTKAEITVSGTGTEWIASEDVIDKYQSEFVTLGNKDAGDKYTHIAFAGDGNAAVTITYGTAVEKYDKATHDNMTQSQLQQMFADGGQETAPEIKSADVWVVYYRVEIENHETVYGIWKVSILDQNEFVIITFVKPYEAEYGDELSSKGILDKLIDDGYITVDGEITDLEELRNVASAYVVYNGDGDTPNKGSYDIVFSVKKGINRDLTFKYGPTNENSSTNVDAYKVVERELEIEWSTTSFVYNGSEQLPTAKLTGLIGGQTVDIVVAIGETRTITLNNGDEITVTVTIEGDATKVGSYTLKVELGKGNYKLKEASKTAVIDITEGPAPIIEEVFPTWAIGLIAGLAGLLLIAILIIIFKKRKKSEPADGLSDDDGFYDPAE